MKLTVNPPVTIDPNGQATITHDGTGTITVTIDDGNGSSETVEVPAGTGGATWKPPAGWDSATFNALGCDEVFRWIGDAADAAAG